MDAFSKVRHFIETELAAGTFPGAGLIVDLKGERVLEYYWGTWCSSTRRDNELHADVTHMLYSFSKGISATIVVLAHQKGLIDYDAPVRTYIPEYRGGWKDATTIRHLLTHASGMVDCPLGAAYTDEQWRACLQSCLDHQTEWEPGSRTPYHWASGMFLASEAVRRSVKGASWEAICREWLFDPIEADSLTFRIPPHGGIALTPRPPELPTPVDAVHFGSLGHPGAGCFGRLEDIIKILRLHLDNGARQGRSIVDPDELAEMHRVQYESEIAEALRAGIEPLHEPYGLGWLLKRHRTNHWFGLGDLTSSRAFGHAGIDTVLGVGDPATGLAIAFVTTDSPRPTGENTTRIRNAVTNLVIEGILC